MVIKTCVVCGKEFNAQRRNCTTCSVECRKEQAKRYTKSYYAKNSEEINFKNRMRRESNKTIKAMAKVKAKQPKLSIDDILKVAKEHNLTYGKAELAIRQGKIKI